METSNVIPFPQGRQRTRLDDGSQTPDEAKSRTGEYVHSEARRRSEIRAVANHFTVLLNDPNTDKNLHNGLTGLIWHLEARTGIKTSDNNLKSTLPEMIGRLSKSIN